MNVRSRDWCFTLNNYTADEVTKIDEMEIICAYMVYGKEVGEECMTPHLQGYIYFNNAKSFAKMKKLFPERTHLEKTAGTSEQASEYCKKEGDFVEFGTLPNKQGKRTDLDDVKDILKETGKMADVVSIAKSCQSVRMAQEILKYTERKRKWKPYVQWFWGPTGSGKSQLAEKMLGEDCYTTLDTGKWWEGYDAHENVHIEDIRGDFLKFHQLLKLLDRYPYRVECKGGCRQFLAKWIIITCCYPPEQLYETREDIQQLLRRIDEVRWIGYKPNQEDVEFYDDIYYTMFQS